MKKVILSLSLLVISFGTFVSAQTSGPDPDDAVARIVKRTYTDVSDADKWEIKASYPEFRKAGGVIEDDFSSVAKKIAMKEVERFKKSMKENAADGIKPPGDMRYSLEIDYTELSFDDGIISVLYSVYAYEGGAHPNSWSHTLNYDRRKSQFIKLNDVFKSGSGWEKMFSDLVVEELIEQQNERGFADKSWIERGAGPNAENFKNWNATKKGFSVVFDAYSVGPYAAGSFTVNVPYSMIRNSFRGDRFYLAESLSYINGSPPNWCRNGLWTTSDDAFRLALVTGKKNERSYFYGDMDGGPMNPASKQKAYLISGDEVIVKRDYMGFSCVWYQPKKGSETVGWIKTEKLVFTPEKVGTAKDWRGDWVFGSSDINIKRVGGELAVTGTALWKGLGDNVHIGELDHKGTPNGTRLRLGDPKEEYSCLVSMTRLGKYLLVRDNLKCGGVNVTFNGVYVRKNR